MTVLRSDLLAGRVVVASGAVLSSLVALGAAVAGGDGPVDALVYDAADAFAGGGLERVLDDAWRSIREVAVSRMVELSHPGKVVLVGPRPGAGPLADAARAGLENLARTLSVEWARYGVTTTMIAPGEGTSNAEVAELVSYLVSHAGDYFTGCRFDLGAARSYGSLT